MTGDKIRLRLKSDNSVELPEATVRNLWLVGQTPGWDLRWGSSTSFFSMDYWESVPPPYVLPTGIGAVVQASHGIYIHLSGGRWVGSSRGSNFTDEIAGWANNGDLTTLSEGVEL